MSGRGPRLISVKTGFTIKTTGTFDATRGYVTIAGTKYTSAAEVQVNAGNEISVYVNASQMDAGHLCWVQKDGVQVQSGDGTYTFTAEADATINMTRNVSGRYSYYTCTITTS